jgi:hypothetical protein
MLRAGAAALRTPSSTREPVRLGGPIERVEQSQSAAEGCRAAGFPAWRQRAAWWMASIALAALALWVLPAGAIVSQTEGVSSAAFSYTSDTTAPDPFGLATDRLASSTYGLATDASSSDDGGSVEGTASVTWGPTQQGYDSFGVDDDHGYLVGKQNGRCWLQ